MVPAADERARPGNAAAVATYLGPQVEVCGDGMPLELGLYGAATHRLLHCAAIGWPKRLGKQLAVSHR